MRAPWVDVRFLFKTAREQPVRGPGVWCDWGINRRKWVCFQIYRIIQKESFHLFYWYENFTMTSSNGNIFRVTGHLCGEFIGHRWVPRTKANDTSSWKTSSLCRDLRAEMHRNYGLSVALSLMTTYHGCVSKLLIFLGVTYGPGEFVDRVWEAFWWLVNIDSLNRICFTKNLSFIKFEMVSSWTENELIALNISCQTDQ